MGYYGYRVTQVKKQKRKDGQCEIVFYKYGRDWIDPGQEIKDDISAVFAKDDRISEMMIIMNVDKDGKAIEPPESEIQDEVSEVQKDDGEKG